MNNFPRILNKGRSSYTTWLHHKNSIFTRKNQQAKPSNEYQDFLAEFSPAIARNAKLFQPRVSTFVPRSRKNNIPLMLLHLHKLAWNRFTIKLLFRRRRIVYLWYSLHHINLKVFYTKCIHKQTMWGKRLLPVPKQNLYRKIICWLSEIKFFLLGDDGEKLESKQ